MSIPMFSVLQTGGAYPDGWLEWDWRPEPTVIRGAFALVGAYLW